MAALDGYEGPEDHCEREKDGSCSMAGIASMCVGLRPGRPEPWPPGRRLIEILPELLEAQGLRPCPERKRSQPCEPLNHEVIRRDGAVISERWFCSCGQTVEAPTTKES